MKLEPQWIRVAPSTKMGALIQTGNSQQRIMEGSSWKKGRHVFGISQAKAQAFWQPSEGRGRGERKEEDGRERGRLPL